MAQALVIRGDDYVYRGERLQALERYRRAMSLAPYSETAVDRFIFVSMQMQTPQSIANAFDAANRYISRHPDDDTVLADRALCYLHVHKYALAARDFERAAASSHAAKYLLFARLSARAEHKR